LGERSSLEKAEVRLRAIILYCGSSLRLSEKERAKFNNPSLVIGFE
jgi:hypothetical protein